MDLTPWALTLEFDDTRPTPQPGDEKVTEAHIDLDAVRKKYEVHGYYTNELVGIASTAAYRRMMEMKELRKIVVVQSRKRTVYAHVLDFVHWLTAKIADYAALPNLETIVLRVPENDDVLKRELDQWRARRDKGETVKCEVVVEETGYEA